MGSQMAAEPRPTRRQVLAAAGLASVCPLAVDAQDLSTSAGSVRAQAGDSPQDQRFVLKSQTLPTPKIRLPIDSLPPPEGPPRRVAALTTAYFKYSHADDIITKFIEGYS